jgi:hypothetical protein
VAGQLNILDHNLSRKRGWLEQKVHWLVKLELEYCFPLIGYVIFVGAIFIPSLVCNYCICCS